MCKGSDCPYRKAADLAAEFAKQGVYASKLCLEKALQNAGYDVPQFSHLYQKRKPKKRVRP